MISLFWASRIHDLPYHLITDDIDKMPNNVRVHKEKLEGRSMLVKKLKMLPYEFIVRGYLSGAYLWLCFYYFLTHVIGSAWNEYKSKGTVWSKPMPKNLLESSKLPEILFTPTTKNNSGGIIKRPNGFTMLTMFRYSGLWRRV